MKRKVVMLLCLVMLTINITVSAEIYGIEKPEYATLENEKYYLWFTIDGVEGEEYLLQFSDDNIKIKKDDNGIYAYSGTEKVVIGSKKLFYNSSTKNWTTNVTSTTGMYTMQPIKVIRSNVALYQGDDIIVQPVKAFLIEYPTENSKLTKEFVATISCVCPKEVSISPITGLGQKVLAKDIRIDWYMDNIESISKLSVSTTDYDVPDHEGEQLIIWRYKIKMKYEGNTTLRFDGYIPEGWADYTVASSIIYPENGEYTSVKIECFDGFVDSNNDGIDDRTGEEQGGISGAGKDSDLSEMGDKPERGQYTDGIIGDVQYGFAIVIYYITYPFRVLAQGMKTAGEHLSNATQWVSQVSGFLGALFGFLPSEVSSLIIGVIASIIIISIIALFRG